MEYFWYRFSGATILFDINEILLLRNIQIALLYVHRIFERIRRPQRVYKINLVPVYFFIFGLKM